MHCAFCRNAMIYVHGHAACANNGCPMFGRNQAECCDGETAGNCPAPTAQLAAVFTAEAAAGDLGGSPRAPTPPTLEPRRRS